MAERTMTIRYTGTQRAVIFEHPPGTPMVTKHGHQVELPATKAKELLKQSDNWQEVKAAPPKDDKAETPKDKPAG